MSGRCVEHFKCLDCCKTLAQIKGLSYKCLSCHDFSFKSLSASVSHTHADYTAMTSYFTILHFAERLSMIRNIWYENQVRARDEFAFVVAPAFLTHRWIILCKCFSASVFVQQEPAPSGLGEKASISIYISPGTNALG